jgi:hypothetical protein
MIGMKNQQMLGKNLMVAEYFTELEPIDVWIEGYGNPYFLTYQLRQNP